MRDHDPFGFAGGTRCKHNFDNIISIDLGGGNFTFLRRPFQVAESPNGWLFLPGSERNFLSGQNHPSIDQLLNMTQETK